jgi:hypothetical protein
MNRKTVTTEDITYDHSTIQSISDQISKKVSILSQLGVADEASFSKFDSIVLINETQEEARKELSSSLGEMMGALERRSELNEEIRQKHKEFSELKSLKLKFEQIGLKLKENEEIISENEENSISNNNKTQEQADILLSSAIPGEEVGSLKIKEKRTKEQELKIKKQLLEIRRQLVNLTNSNQILYEEMESVERLSFKLFYFLLSEGQTNKVTPVIEQSLMEATMRRSNEIDSVFKSEEVFSVKVRDLEAKVETLGKFDGVKRLKGLWTKAFGKSEKHFSLFDEFVV